MIANVATSQNWNKQTKKKKNTRGLSHCGLAIYIKKYLKAKEEYYENSNNAPCKNIIFKKIL
jgi:hypothetical protein